MNKKVKYIGIGGLVCAVTVTFFGAFMKVKGLEYANLFLTIGMLSIFIPILVIALLVIEALTKK